jgi:uncharacterized membrane protein YbhN (UPF0104 family)
VKPISAFVRIFLTIAFLVAIVFFISFQKIIDAVSRCDLRWVLVTFSLMPVYMTARLGKWFLLVRQIDEDATMLKILPSYLRGMALGLITPGRLGELARVQAMKQPGKCAGLFFLEKSIEVGCLLSLCLVSIIILNFWVWWAATLLMVMLITCAIMWRKILIISIRLTGQWFKWPSPDKLEKIEWAISNFKIGGCAFLSATLFLLIIIQIYMILLGMGTPADPLIFPLIPLVLLTNLVPITVGGYGVRETAAVFLFNLKHIEAAVSASSVGIPIFFNIVIPGLIGAGIHLFYRPNEAQNRELDSKQL